MRRKQNHGQGAARRWCTLGLIIVAAAAPAPAEESWQSPLIIPAAEFENDGVYPIEDKFFDVEGYFTGTNVTLLGMVAPVYLPDTVTVTRFEAAMVDLGDCPAQPDPEVLLMRTHLNSGDEDILASVSAADNGNIEIFADTTIANPTVNNLAYQYFVVAYSCGLFQAVQGVRIHYLE